MSKSEKCPRCGAIQECLIGGTPHYACLSTVSLLAAVWSGDLHTNQRGLNNRAERSLQTAAGSW